MGIPIGAGQTSSNRPTCVPRHDQCTDETAGVRSEQGTEKQIGADRIDTTSIKQLKARSELHEIVDRYVKLGNIGRALGSGGLRSYRMIALSQIPDAKLEQLIAERVDQPAAAQIAAELRKATAQHLVGEAAGRVQDAARRLDQGLEQALESSAARQTLLRQMPAETRVPFLRSLGLDSDTAMKIARDPAGNDKPFRQALSKARETLGDLAFVSDGALFRKDLALQLLDNHRPVVSQLRSDYSIKRGSVADRAIATVMAEGSEAKRFNDAFKVGAGLVASAAVTITTLGTGVAFPAICSAVGAGLMDAPAVMGAKSQADRLSLLHHQGLVGERELSRAQEQSDEAVVDALVGVAAAGAGSAATGLMAGRMAAYLPHGSLERHTVEVVGSTFTPEVPKAVVKALGQRPTD